MEVQQLRCEGELPSPVDFVTVQWVQARWDPLGLGPGARWLGRWSLGRGGVLAACAPGLTACAPGVLTDRALRVLLACAPGVLMACVPRVLTSCVPRGCLSLDCSTTVRSLGDGRVAVCGVAPRWAGLVPSAVDIRWVQLRLGAGSADAGHRSQGCWPGTGWRLTPPGRGCGGACRVR